jgi:hypothetical protein
MPADCELGLALRLCDGGLSPQPRAVLLVRSVTSTAGSCAGWSPRIYNPDPDRDGADATVRYITQGSPPATSWHAESVHYPLIYTPIYCSGCAVGGTRIVAFCAAGSLCKPG